MLFIRSKINVLKNHHFIIGLINFMFSWLISSNSLPISLFITSCFGMGYFIVLFYLKMHLYFWVKSLGRILSKRGNLSQNTLYVSALQSSPLSIGLPFSVLFLLASCICFTFIDSFGIFRFKDFNYLVLSNENSSRLYDSALNFLSREWHWIISVWFWFYRSYIIRYLPLSMSDCSI